MEQISFGFSVPPAVRKPLLPPIRLEAVRRQWSERFERFYPTPFSVYFNDNSSTMISSRRRQGMQQLRLHYMFLRAQDEVLAALADYLQGRACGNRCLDRFIARNHDLVGRRRLRAQRCSRGRRFDLLRIRDALNRAYFQTPIEVPVVWGSRRSGGRRSIRLGSYSFEERVIRINPVLDQDTVPAFVVVAVVYHEMLHHLLGSRRVSGRRLVHTREFRTQESRFVHHRRAVAWERENLTKMLMGSRSSRRPTPPLDGTGRVHLE